MQFSFSTDQLDFAAALRDLLERECTAAHVRHVWESGAGTDAALWARLAEMGVLSMMVPADNGGMGADFVDTILLIEELGRAAVPGPVVETMTLGALALGDGALAAGIVDGSTPVTAAVMGEPYIPHAATSRYLIVAGTLPNELALLHSADALLTSVEGIDGGRALSSIAPGAPTTPLRLGRDAALNAGALATSAYLLGLSSRMLAIAGDYARDRRQFGQPIGAFQAVKHLMADALLKVEFARPAVYRAAWSVAVGAPDVDRDVSMAKALASDAAQKAARSALQVHGAIGYTWECDLQLYMKKAWALLPAWGSAQFHRRRVADAVLGVRP